MNRRRVFVDLFELVPGQGRTIGVFNYAKGLLPALAEQLREDHELVLALNPSAVNDFPVQPERGISHWIVGRGSPGRASRVAWLMGRASRHVARTRADIYFSPRGFLPRGLKLFAPHARSVTVCHDLIRHWYSDHFPKYFNALEHRFLVSSMSYALRQSDAVVAISQATADDISARIARPSRTTVVHNGIPRSEAGPAPTNLPYIFAVTSSLPHKNAQRLLQAYALYRQRAIAPLPLLVCGIDDPGVPGVRATGRLSNEQLHGHYAGAALFVFLSLIEGFGFPPLEALLQQTPVLCSDIPSLREVTLGQTRYVDPNSTEACAAAMFDALEERRPPSQEFVTELEARFNWQQCAAGVADVIRNV